MKLKKLLVLPVLCLVLLSAVRVQASPQAAATAASLELSASSYLIGSPVTIRVYDVTAAGSSFRIYFTYDLSGTDTLETKTEFANMSVHLGLYQVEWTYTMIFVGPTAGSSITVHVGNGTGTQLASQQIMAQDPEDLLPTDLIITIGVALMIILIIVGIVTGLARKRR